MFDRSTASAPSTRGTRASWTWTQSEEDPEEKQTTPKTDYLKKQTTLNPTEGITMTVNTRITIFFSSVGFLLVSIWVLGLVATALPITVGWVMPQIFTWITVIIVAVVGVDIAVKGKFPKS